MGLLFAVEPDLRQSKEQELILRSSKKKFGLGMGMLLGGTFLGTMYYAAKPLFDTFLREGSLFDQSLAVFFMSVVISYPLIAALCFAFEKVIIIRKCGASYNLEAKNKLFFFEWKNRRIQNIPLSQFQIKNWKGTVNTATLKAEQSGQTDRYSTRGHWYLEVSDKDNAKKSLILERRARRDDIEFLKAQIESFFHEPAISPLN